MLAEPNLPYPPARADGPRDLRASLVARVPALAPTVLLRRDVRPPVPASARPEAAETARAAAAS